MIENKRCLLIAVFLFGVIFSSKAQHYFFIEADGQQAFYIKKSDTLYSSSANGFLIMPKNTEKTFAITIGFPQNKYPEAIFNLDEMDQDRGFQLKNFKEKGWGLFDRTSFQIIMQASPNVLAEQNLPIKTEKEDKDLSNTVSVVPDDKPILTKEKIVTKSSQKNPASKQIAKPVKETSKSNIKGATYTAKATNVITQVKIDSSDRGFLKIKYLDKSSDGKTDVVDLKIEVSSSNEASKIGVTPTSSSSNEKQSIKLNNSNLADSDGDINNKSKAGISGKCSFPPASDKDVKNIQRKLLGYVEGDEQLKFAEKAYSSKCFTTNQTMEISWFLLNEDIRLGFFEKIFAHISDQENIKLLEVGFVKDVNIKAFRSLFLQN